MHRYMQFKYRISRFRGRGTRLNNAVGRSADELPGNIVGGAAPDEESMKRSERAPSAKAANTRTDDR